MSEEEKAEKKKLAEANAKIEKMLAEDEAERQRKIDEDKRKLAEADELNTGKNLVEAAEKEFDAA